MKVGIVGAGAMGCLLGGYLAKAAEDVRLIDIWQEHVARLNSSGLIVASPGKSETYPVHASTRTQDVGICDVVIISTKFRHTRRAVRDALCLIDAETIVMTIQNGIGNTEMIAEFVDEKNIIFGLTTLGSVLTGPGEIKATFSEEAVTYLWTWVGDPNDKAEEVIAIFNNVGLNFQLAPDVRERIWRKIALNAGLSVPLAIPRLKCGDFINQPSSLELIRGLVFEIVAVANMEGISIEPEETYKYVVGLAKQAPDHLTSALIDVLNHRKTEIDSLNGAIVAKAKENGIEVPFNTVITNIIKIIENTYDKSVQHH